IRSANVRSKMAKLSQDIKKGVPMITVPDIAAALAWYASIGFKEMSRYENGGRVTFGMMSFGKAELMLNLNGKRGEHDTSFWFYTDKVDELYLLLKSRQIEAATTG